MAVQLQKDSIRAAVLQSPISFAAGWRWMLFQPDCLQEQEQEQETIRIRIIIINNNNLTTWDEIFPCFRFSRFQVSGLPKARDRDRGETKVL